jgi:hypothetical protein
MNPLISMRDGHQTAAQLKPRGASTTAPHLVILTLAAFLAASEGPKSGALSAFPYFPFVKLPTSTVAKGNCMYRAIRVSGYVHDFGLLSGGKDT